MWVYVYVYASEEVFSLPGTGVIARCKGRDMVFENTTLGEQY